MLAWVILALGPAAAAIVWFIRYDCVAEPGYAITCVSTSEVFYLIGLAALAGVSMAVTFLKFVGLFDEETFVLSVYLGFPAFLIILVMVLCVYVGRALVWPVARLHRWLHESGGAGHGERTLPP